MLMFSMCVGNTALGLVLCQPIIALSANITTVSNQTNETRSSLPSPLSSIFQGGAEHGISLRLEGITGILIALVTIMLIL